MLNEFNESFGKDRLTLAGNPDEIKVFRVYDLQGKELSG